MIHESNIGFFDNDHLRSSSFCPLCKAKIPNIDIRILESNEIATLVHVTCKRCKGATVVMNYAGQLGINAVGLVTDLSSDELLKVVQKEPVSADEVITFYESLQKKTEKTKRKITQGVSNKKD